MKVLVTGASGGMGSYIINNLLQKGIEVVATSRDEAKIKNLEFFNKVNYIPYDINLKSRADLFTYFEKPDSIIHLAWDKLKEHKSELHTTSILENHKVFIGNLIDNGIRDINVVGTCYEYGLREGILKETDPPAPVVPYAIGKNLLREFIEEKQYENKFSFKWMRVFNVFSEGKSGGNLYSHLMNAVQSKQEFFNMSGGEQVRDYLTAQEVADRIVKISLQDKVHGIINCGSGKPVKLKDMITEFIKKNNYQIKLNLGYYPYLDYEPMAHWGSTEKLDKVLKEDWNERK